MPNEAFLDAAATEIDSALKRLGPPKKREPWYELISAEEYAKTLALYEAQPKSAFLRKLDALTVGGNALKTSAPLNSVKARVSSFARKTGRKFRVFEYANTVLCGRTA
jgi:hypothetical protein